MGPDRATATWATSSFTSYWSQRLSLALACRFLRVAFLAPLLLLGFALLPAALLGLALGAKLAMKDRLVVSVIGDGSFMYNPVTQSLALSKHKDIPIMIVVFNNQGYSAMRKEHHSYYPDGVAAASNA